MESRQNIKLSRQGVSARTKRSQMVFELLMNCDQVYIHYKLS